MMPVITLEMMPKRPEHFRTAFGHWRGPACMIIDHRTLEEHRPQVQLARKERAICIVFLAHYFSLRLMLVLL